MTTPPPPPPEQWVLAAATELAGQVWHKTASEKTVEFTSIITQHAAALTAENVRLNAALLVSVTKAEAADGRINELEQSQAALLAENVRLKKELKDLHRSISCEHMDPNGTIWDHADKMQEENERLRGEVIVMQEDRDRIVGYLTEERRDFAKRKKADDTQTIAIASDLAAHKAWGERAVTGIEFALHALQAADPACPVDSLAERTVRAAIATGKALLATHPDAK